MSALLFQFLQHDPKVAMMFTLSASTSNSCYSKASHNTLGAVRKMLKCKVMAKRCRWKSAQRTRHEFQSTMNTIQAQAFLTKGRRRGKSKLSTKRQEVNRAQTVYGRSADAVGTVGSGKFECKYSERCWTPDRRLCRTNIILR